MSRLGILSLLGASLCASVVAGDGSDDRQRRPVLELAANPLRSVRTVRLVEPGGFVAWARPTLCDPAGNAYFLVAPVATDQEIEEAARSRRELPLNPREVVRISADGKKRTTFDPALGFRGSGVTDVATFAMDLDDEGSLFLLVWTTSGRAGDGGERAGQLIVSVDERGAHRSSVEIDADEILVNQFAVFGSGDFLLRGQRPGTSEERVAILPASGGSIRDVMGWSGYPSGSQHDQEDAVGRVRFDYMTRGRDGRVYFAEQDARYERVVVHALGPSGDSFEAFELWPTEPEAELLGFQAARDRFAAMYRERAPVRGDGGHQPERWWVAVYDGVSAEQPPPVYGPLSSAPVCFRRAGSRDELVFFVDGEQLVSMTP